MALSPSHQREAVLCCCRVAPESTNQSAPATIILDDMRAENTQEGTLECDYLCIGAGAACMSFVDTMLTSTKSATFIIVDKHAHPGGHWNIAYPFVKLHQPAGFYGVESEPLGNIDPKTGYEMLDPTDLSSKQEMLAYYARVMDKFIATGRVKFFPSVVYDVSKRCFVDKDDRLQAVKFEKLVTPESNVVVPAMRPPPFPIASGRSACAVVKPVNEILDEAHANYVVLGCGKTGVDAVYAPATCSPSLSSLKPHTTLTWHTPSRVCLAQTPAARAWR